MSSSYFLKITCLFVAIGVVECAGHGQFAWAKYWENRISMEPDMCGWFNQTLDHFAPGQHRSFFGQRYFENMKYFRKPSGPVFLRICGEAPCGGTGNDYLMVLAKRFGAAVVALEHRYYGRSNPFHNLSAENLRFLSSKQALADLATFREYYQGTLDLRFSEDLNTYGRQKWIVFGISYAGALSAWFHLKYPHLTSGAIASSAVVQAILSFSGFDEQVAESAGLRCAHVLREVTKQVEAELASNSTAVKAKFGASRVANTGDFFYLLADAAALAIQYGHPDALCVPLVRAYAQGEDIVAVYIEFVRSFFFEKMGVTAASYDRDALLDLSPYGPNAAGRLWWFQMCTEVAFFQVAPERDSIRSQSVDLEYHLDMCSYLFGNGTAPDVDFTNLFYGGRNIRGSRIFFTNGSQDPWRRASKTASSPGEPSETIYCSNCGHGSDFRGCPQSPGRPYGDASKCDRPDDVRRVRRTIRHHITTWLSDEKEENGALKVSEE